MERQTWVTEEVADAGPCAGDGSAAINRLLLNLMILPVYLAIAAGYGAWLGNDFRDGFQGAWILLPPFVVEFVNVFKRWRRVQPLLLVTSLLFALAMGGLAIGITWPLTELTLRFSDDAAVRALISVSFVLVVFGGVAFVVWHETRGSKTTEHCPEERS